MILTEREDLHLRIWRSWKGDDKDRQGKSSGKAFVLPRDEAIKFMEEKSEPYKVELIEDLPDEETISFYQQGEFADLCAGPHIMYTKGVKAFKLTSIAGAYWRGSEKNKMLTRIYGTAFRQ